MMNGRDGNFYLWNESLSLNFDWKCWFLSKFSAKTCFFKGNHQLCQGMGRANRTIYGVQRLFHGTIDYNIGLIL